MEKRIGVVAILVQGKESVARLNETLSRHGEIILARQGLPFKERGIQVISLIVEGTTNQLGALCGAVGRLPRIQVKSVLAPGMQVPGQKEPPDDPHQDLP